MARNKSRIGRWSFDPASNELCCEGETVRLEERAARVLDVLFESRGTVVTRAELIERVWHGRQVSDNSVPMVIGQLRRSLGDTAKGSLIETIPKRGYRLANSVPAPEETKTSWIKLAMAAALLVLVLIVTITAQSAIRAETIGVPPLVDQTGDPAYAALARATDALLVAELAERGFTVERPGHTRQASLRARLVMWEGEPYLALEAMENGTIDWSAMIGGGKGAIPRELDEELDRWLASRGA